MSTIPSTNQKNTSSERSHQDADATIEVRSSSSPIQRTANRTGMFGPVQEYHTEQEHKAARTMLALRTPVVFPTQARERNTLQNMSTSVPSYESDDERTITAEPSPDTTTTRRAIPHASHAVTSESDGTVRTPSSHIIAAAPGSTPRKITLAEYIAMRNLRRDRDPSEGA
jgi:predicted DNA binding CopG/RHH family protein